MRRQGRRNRWEGLWRHFRSEPVSLGAGEKVVVAVAGGGAVLLTGWLTQWAAGTGSVMLLASMGASAAILFAMPASPLAQPWPLLGGQLLSAAVGVGCSHVLADRMLAAGAAVGLALLLMLWLRCLHPPGAATALAPVLAATPPPADFLLAPVAGNVLLMFALAWLINRRLLRRDYPLPAVPRPAPPHQTVTVADAEQVIAEFGHFLDVGSADVLLIYQRLQQLAQHRQAAAAVPMRRDAAGAARRYSRPR